MSSSNKHTKVCPQCTKVCPQCKKEFTPNFDDPNAGSPMDKEQHITGLCSDVCWDKFIGIVN